MGQADSALGVVVMAYGTPASLDDVERYYTHIRRGRPPTAEQLAELVGRYEAIGGTSPLAIRTEEQRAALQAALDARAPDATRVVLAHKHAAPYIEDAAAALAGGGVERVVGLVLAPHFARASVGEYHARLLASCSEHGMAAATIDSWHLEPAYVAFLADAVREAREPLAGRTQVVFTAHSLPERALAGNDPYPDQLAASAAAAAAAAGLGTHDWSLAWQSAGRTAEPWCGPDIRDVICDIGRHGTADAVLVCPQGFVSDHLEVLYDLDVQAAAVARDVGVAFARTRVLNAHAPVVEALADRVLAAAPT